MLLAATSEDAAAASWGQWVWRADALAQAAGAVLPSGYALLDAALPGGGWPVGALCELLQPPAQHHEWRLLLPGLRACMRAHAQTQVGSRACSVVLVGAPHTPFGPGLMAWGLDVRQLLWLKVESARERLWASEQALRCAGVQAVLAWLPTVRSSELRRLHLAAQAHDKFLFVMRPAASRDEASPAVLRLLAQQAAGTALALQVLKRRGPPLTQTLQLDDQRAALSVFLAAAGVQPVAAAATQCASPTHALPVPSHALDCLAGAA